MSALFTYLFFHLKIRKKTKRRQINDHTNIYIKRTSQSSREERSRFSKNLGPVSSRLCPEEDWSRFAQNLPSDCALSVKDRDESSL